MLRGVRRKHLWHGTAGRIWCWGWVFCPHCLGCCPTPAEEGHTQVSGTWRVAVATWGWAVAMLELQTGAPSSQQRESFGLSSCQLSYPHGFR